MTWGTLNLWLCTKWKPFMCAVAQFSFQRCPLQFTDAQSHARQWLKHKSLVPKADVHQLFFTRRSDINSLLETVERCKGTEEIKLWSVREEDGVCILVVKVLLQWLVLDSWGPGYCEKRAQTETDVEDVLIHRERRDGDMKREEVTKGA